MKKEVGYIYKNEDGEYFESVEKNGQICLSNPSYPFVFLFEVLEPLELIGKAEEFRHLVETKDYEFHEGDTLTVEVGDDGNLKAVDSGIPTLYPNRKLKEDK